MLDFRFSARETEYRDRVKAFLASHVAPADAAYHHEVASGDRWAPVAMLEPLKAKAQAAGREVIRVSFGRTTTAAEVDAFVAAWRQMARTTRRAA